MINSIINNEVSDMPGFPNNNNTSKIDIKMTEIKMTEIKMTDIKMTDIKMTDITSNPLRKTIFYRY